MALLFAIVCGQLTRVHVGFDRFGFYNLFGLSVVEIYNFMGQLFLNALKMLIVPLIASAVINGIAGMGSEKAFGRLGLKTLGYYLVTTLLAILVGLFFVNVLRPGIVDGKPASHLLGLVAPSEQMVTAVGDRSAGDLVDFFLRMIPTNVVQAATDNGQMLSLIFFSLLFGFFVSRLKGDVGTTMRNFWQGVYDIMIMITDLVMKFLPLGVFGLVAKVSASTAPKDFSALFVFFITVLLGLAFHFFLTLPLIVKVLGRVKPSLHFKAMSASLLTAFSTSSSSATVPVTIDCLQKNAGVSPRVTSFVTPLGATVNMDGTALYECVSVIFLAQVYGVHLAIGQQLMVVALALLTSIGVAGIPSASLVAIVVILTSLGIPAEGIGLLMVFDRILDMCRTAVNVFSDSCGAVVIARSEGETTNLV